jgi:molybdate transport system substrate-binding protein
VRRAATVLIAAVLVGACSGSDDADLHVYAAASLAEAFEVLVDEFEATRPGIDVSLNLAGSQTLATQILAGAPADVFAPADQFQMQRVLDEIDPAHGPWTFATNSLAIAVEKGNPEGIAGLGDLGREDLTIVLAAPEVPAGRYTTEILERAGVTVAAASLEPDVRSVLAKVSLGEADVGIVYRSDLFAAREEVDGVDIPPEMNVVAEYPIIALDGSNSLAAVDFVEFVRSDIGRLWLVTAGFEA